MKEKPAEFSKENTCIILIDLWGLSDEQIEQLGPVYNAWIYTREKIAELVRMANTHSIPIYLQNHNWPIPTTPISLKEALLESNVVINQEVFIKEGHKHTGSPWEGGSANLCGNITRRFLRLAGRIIGFGHQKNSLINNTVDFKDYENLIYAGYALDACVAGRGERDDCGYSTVSTSHHRFMIKDAGLVQYVLYHGKNYELWPEYSKLMKARGPEEPLPWKTPQDIIDETVYFCDNFATKFCASLFLDEFEKRLR